MYSTQMLNNKFICMANDGDYNDCFDTAKTGIIHIDGAGIINNLNREAEKICAVERTNILGKTVETAFQDFGAKFLKLFAFPECEDHYSINLKLSIKEKVSYINNVVKELVLFANPPIIKEPGVNINSIIDDALFLVLRKWVERK